MDGVAPEFVKLEKRNGSGGFEAARLRGKESPCIVFHPTSMVGGTGWSESDDT